MPIKQAFALLLALMALPAFAEIPAHDHKCAVDFPDAMYPWYWTPNHCGPDDWRKPFIPNKIFLGAVDIRPACDNHDICTMTIGKGHSECVGEFNQDLKRICRKEYPSIAQTPLREACFVTVEGFARAVQAFGADRHWVGQTGQRKFNECVAEHGWQPRTAFRCKNGTCTPKLISTYTREDLHEEREEYCKTNCTMNERVADEYIRRRDREMAEFERMRPQIERERAETTAFLEKYGTLLQMTVDSLEKYVADMDAGKVPVNELMRELLKHNTALYADRNKTLDIEVEYAVYNYEASRMVREEVARRGLNINPDYLRRKFDGKTMRTVISDGVKSVTLE